jgi:tetratricopeptide (TPR) repeat protein
MAVPNTARLLVDQLRIKLMSHTDGRHLLNEIWDLPEAAAAGDEIVIQYRITAGKQFECRAFLGEAEADEESEGFVRTIENPLVNVNNPGSIRLKIEETEEKLRVQKEVDNKKLEDYVNLATWYAELNQLEKALYYLRTALRKKGEPSAYISNLMGIYYKNLKDYGRAEKAYQEAIRADRNWSTPSFNLALLYKKTDRHDEALTIIDDTLEKTNDRGAYLVLKADILNRMGQKTQAKKVATKALEAFAPVKEQSQWELGWYVSNAFFLEDNKALNEATAERDRRKQAKAEEPLDDDTPRPVVKGSLVPFARTSAA